MPSLEHPVLNICVRGELDSLDKRTDVRTNGLPLFSDSSLAFHRVPADTSSNIKNAQTPMVKGCTVIIVSTLSGAVHYVSGTV